MLLPSGKFVRASFSELSVICHKRILENKYTAIFPQTLETIKKKEAARARAGRKFSWRRGGAGLWWEGGNAS